MSGVQMPASVFSSALDIFGEYVYPEVLREHCTRQLDFDREIWYKKTRPIELHTNEELHLAERRELKNGKTRNI